MAGIKHRAGQKLQYWSRVEVERKKMVRAGKVGELDGEGDDKRSPRGATGVSGNVLNTICGGEFKRKTFGGRHA